MSTGYYTEKQQASEHVVVTAPMFPGEPVKDGRLLALQGYLIRRKRNATR
jgi:hypothetical protein